MIKKTRKRQYIVNGYLSRSSIIDVESDKFRYTFIISTSEEGVIVLTSPIHHETMLAAAPTLTDVSTLIQSLKQRYPQLSV